MNTIIHDMIGVHGTSKIKSAGVSKIKSAGVFLFLQILFLSLFTTEEDKTKPNLIDSLCSTCPHIKTSFHSMTRTCEAHSPQNKIEKAGTKATAFLNLENRINQRYGKSSNIFCVRYSYCNLIC